jgi:hypothetical protein
MPRFRFTLLNQVYFDFCGADLSSLFRISWTIDFTLIGNRRLFSVVINAVSYLRLHKRLLDILALFVTIYHKYVVEALTCAEVLSPREHGLYRHRLAIFSNRHVCKSNLAFASIGKSRTIYHLILPLASHDFHQSMVLIVKLVEIFVEVRLS